MHDRARHTVALQPAGHARVEFGGKVARPVRPSRRRGEQSCQGDQRRSRSAAQNIIPNANASAACVEQLMPRFAGRLSGCALNVPVQHGSLLDLNCVLRNVADAAAVNAVMRAAAAARPALIAVAEDPIVSSDVIGCRQTLLFDAPGTQRAGSRMVKTLAWYETLGHACRVLDVARAYAALA